MNRRASSNRLMSFAMRFITFPLRPSYTADFERFNVYNEKIETASYTKGWKISSRLTFRNTKPEQPSRILTPTSQTYKMYGWKVTTDTADENTMPAAYQ